MNLSDAEIIKALECCANNPNELVCYESKCPLFGQKCIDILSKNAFDLINRQQKTIDRLKAENKNCGVKIQNQREQLKACNEKIGQLNVELRTITENLLNESIPVFCDKYCRYPLECQSQEELDEHCDNCEFIKILNLKEGEKEDGKLHCT